VRGDTWLTLRLLARRQGAAGAAIALAGGLVLAGALLPWLRAVATVTMLGGDDTTRLGSTSLVQQPAGVVALVAGLTLVVVGVGVAIDRPAPRAGQLVAAAIAVAGVAAIVATVPVPAATALASARVADLDAVAEELPRDVAVATGVRPGPGPAVLAAGLIAAGVGALVARER
jgi:hypothetical protein